MRVGPESVHYDGQMRSTSSASSRSSFPSRSAKKASTAADVATDLGLIPGQSIGLLKALHILTQDGHINQDSRRKLKQVNHLLHFIEPLLQQVMAARGDVTLADHGAGKSYLGFMLYDRFFQRHSVGHVYGIETRTDLVARSQELADALGFARMSFLPLSVQAAMSSEALPTHIDVVTALHACDTATDDAIAFGLAKHAQHMVLVPCCQAEVASVFRKLKAQSLSRQPLSEIWRHAMHTREFGSYLTNVLRCLQLEAHGYHVTVTELVGWEHSMKNELILASKTNAGKHSAAQRLRHLLDEFGLVELHSRFAVRRGDEVPSPTSPP